MAFNADFQINSLVIPQGFTITDTSTGTDPNIVLRQIFIVQADGTQDGILWPLSEGNSKTLNILQVDKCLGITLAYTSSNPLPPPSEYTKEGLFNFLGNSLQFAASKWGVYASDYMATADTNFVNNLNLVFLNIRGSRLAGETGQQMWAQAALDRIQYLKTYQYNFF